MVRRPAVPSADPAWIRKTLLELVRFRSDRPEDRRLIAALAERQLPGLGARLTRHGSAEAPAPLASFGEGGVLFSGHLRDYALAVAAAR